MFSCIVTVSRRIKIYVKPQRRFNTYNACWLGICPHAALRTHVPRKSPSRTSARCRCTYDNTNQGVVSAITVFWGGAGVGGGQISDHTLIYHTEPTSERWKKENLRSKKRICSEVSVNSPGNSWSQSRRINGRLWREGFAEKESFKPGMKERGVMDDESGESMEPIEEVPLEELGNVM